MSTVWAQNEDRTLAFLGGKEQWPIASRMASACPLFSEDVEDELVADDPRSCYNCRFRRWSSTSFTCMKGADPGHPAYHD